MNLNGIGASLSGIRPLQPDPRLRPETERAAQGTAHPAGTPALREPAAAQAAAMALPVAPPPGTDPELWSVLSHEERAFFAKVGAMGPLTYGRMMGSTPTEIPTARGGRLDVRG
jgi:hypothetical protein